MKKQDISDIIRNADRNYEVEAPADALWSKIESQIDNEAVVRPISNYKTAKLRKLKIAASFLCFALLGAWALFGLQTEKEHLAQNHLQVEGELLLNTRSQPVFTNVYEGVKIVEGKIGDQLRSCGKC